MFLINLLLLSDYCFFADKVRGYLLDIGGLFFYSIRSE